MSTRTRLSRAALAALPESARPRVDARDLRTRVVHLGLGAFHRAHQAVYTEIAAAVAGEPWGIAAVAPRSTGVRDALRAQDGLYTVTGGAGTRVVGVLTEALGMRTDPERVAVLLAAPETTVATLTVTEKGYHRRPDGRLDLDDADVAADLAGGAPRTVVGTLAAAARRRGDTPLTVVCCDNMARNGEVVEGAVREFVAATAWSDRDAVLARLGVDVTFPSCVVDRIVPATTDADRTAVAAVLGVEDAVPVVGEAYRQWVIEDRFAGPRPLWERAGALLVDDVAPYQLTKLRLLNGAHSALAYLGLAAGCGTVADTQATEWGPRLVDALAAEVGPTLPAGGPDPFGYAADLRARFADPTVRHLLVQIGTDGTLKLPERWLAPLRELPAAPVLTVALAAWAVATRPGTDGRQRYGTTDPAAVALAACWDGPDPVRALLRAVGAPHLAADDRLVAAVREHLPALDAGRIEF